MRESVQGIVLLLIMFSVLCGCICFYHMYRSVARRVIARRMRRWEHKFIQLPESSLSRRKAGRLQLELYWLLLRPEALLMLSNLFAADGGAIPESDNGEKVIVPTLLGLIPRYRRRSAIERGILAQTLGGCGLSAPGAMAFLEDCVRSGPVFLRLQAFSAMARLGDAADMRRVMCLLGDSGQVPAPGLLCESFSVFAEKERAFVLGLLHGMDALCPQVRCAVVERLRALGETTCALQLVAMLEDGRETPAVHRAVLRYLKDLPSPSALPATLRATESLDMETVAVAAQTLSAYPDIRSLARAWSLLSSPDWQVRRCAAQTLASLAPAPCYYNDLLHAGDAKVREALSSAVSGGRQERSA